MNGTSVAGEPLWTLTDEDDNDGAGMQSLTLNASPTDATEIQMPEEKKQINAVY